MSEHIWHEWHSLTCCKLCGIVKRADGKNNPCKGVVMLRPMEKPLSGFGHGISKEAAADIHKIKGAKMPAKPIFRINDIEGQKP